MTDVWDALRGGLMTRAVALVAEHGVEGAAFDRAMEQGWQGRIERLDSVDFRGDETVVDIGGGNDSLLPALLESHPPMREIVFDLPRRCATSRRCASSAPFAPRRASGSS
jgi:hypothetical protein